MLGIPRDDLPKVEEAGMAAAYVRSGDALDHGSSPNFWGILLVTNGYPLVI